MSAATVAASAPAARRFDRDRVGLNAANFFLAELTGVVMPFLAKLLAERGWRDDAIQYAAAACGLGVFLAQTPAGIITDRVRARRELLAVASGGASDCSRSSRPSGGRPTRSCSPAGSPRRSSSRSWGRWPSGWPGTLRSTG